MEGVDAELSDVVQAAAAKAMAVWGYPPDIGEAEDLAQELWVWYSSRPSAQEYIAKSTSRGGKFNTFLKAANQFLADAALRSDAFQDKNLYSASVIREALEGRSAHKDLLRILPEALDELERTAPQYREALRSRYDDGVVPDRTGAGKDKLSHAVTALTKNANVSHITGADEGRGVDPRSRRATGVHTDPTADLALGLMKIGDKPEELVDGSFTTYREEIMKEGFDATLARRRTDGQANPAAMPDGVFDENFIGQDRADMYRAQVFPELYPDEKRMLIENWPDQDLEAYCGGRFTPGFRKFTVVR